MNERQKEILGILYQKGRASVLELSQTLFVSEMTVRRDLIEMEKGGFLRRYRGGAILKINLGEMPIGERLLLDRQEKEELAKKLINLEALPSRSIITLNEFRGFDNIPTSMYLTSPPLPMK